MALKLEDLIGKKKEAAQVLDLAKATANTQEEFKKVLDKIPEFRIKPEKVKPEDVKIQEKIGRRGRSGRGRDAFALYQFSDPIPLEMQQTRLQELCSVGIQWTMLTTLRPKNKLDEEYFSRLVELGKLKLQTEEKEKKILVAHFLRRMKNRSGVIESRYVSCKECGEEFCQQEACSLFQYEAFKRPISAERGKKQGEGQDEEEGTGAEGGEKKKKKKKGGGTAKNKKKKTKKTTDEKGRPARKSRSGTRRSKSPKKSDGKSKEDKTRKKQKKGGQAKKNLKVKPSDKKTLSRRKRSWKQYQTSKEEDSD